MDLKIDVQRIDDSAALIAIEGEVDVYTAPQLKQQIISLIEDGTRNVIVSLEAVEYLDSTALGVLIGCLKRLRENDGSLDIICGKGRIRRIFEITGLDNILNISPSLDSLLQKTITKENS